MPEIRANIILNIEINDPDLISKLDSISMELSLSLDEFILASINKLLYDITFIRKIRAK